MATHNHTPATAVYFSSDIATFQVATKHMHNQWEITLLTDVCIGRGEGGWVTVRGTHVFWLNRTADHRTMLVVPCESTEDASQHEAYRAALELSQSVAIATDLPVRVENWWSGSGCRRFPPPRIEHHTNGRHIFDPTPALEFGYARKGKEAIAVACFAAARNSSDCMSEFLHYFRILEVIFGRNRDRNQKTKKMTNLARSSWVNTTSQLLESDYQCSRVTQLTSAGVGDMDEYLYETNRCAIAHAADLGSVADPSDPAHIRRVASDVDLMRLLARKAIIDHLPNAGLKSVY
tara:strand:+ start:6209 stop:7081 length:873 start_codon:yes stop_codon:yes gene_type:complete